MGDALAGVTMNKLLLAAAVAAPLAVMAPEMSWAQSRSDLTNAQNATPDAFARDHNISVRERPRPEYEAGGAHLGGFMAFPKIELDGEYNDNIYATDTATVSDWIFRFKPEMVLQSTWSRHYLAAYARASINRYADHSSEDTNDWDLGADARLDLLRSDAIFAGAEASRLTEPRTSSNLGLIAEKPVQYDYDQANLAYAHTFNRLKLSARGDWRHYNYDDVPALGGGVVDEDFRDRNVQYYTGRADYAVSPDTAIFVQAAYNVRNYRLPGTLAVPQRDSNGWEVLGGANFDLTNLVRGEIGIGYLDQRYDSAAFKDIKGFGARARVDWFVDPLTTVNGTVSRTVEDSGIPGSAGFLSTNAALTVDHELLRNLILTGQVGYGHDDYNAIDRVDKRWNLGVSATYLMNRRVGVNLGYNHFDQKSSGLAAGPDFKVNRATVALILQY